MSDNAPFPLPEPENPGEIAPVDLPPSQPVFPDEGPNISDARDDVFKAGRSPMWDGDPVLDRHLRQLDLDEEPNPRQLEMHQLELICQYCGKPMAFRAGEPPHTCEEQLRRFFPPGRLVKLGDERWAIILETTGEGSIAYYTLPHGVFIEEPLKELSNRIQ